MLTPEEKRLRVEMITGILLAELPPARAELLLVNLCPEFYKEAMDDRERLEILNSVFHDLHERADAYAAGLPDHFKRFSGITT